MGLEATMTERREWRAHLTERFRAEGYDVRDTSFFVSGGELLVGTPSVAVAMQTEV